MRVGRQDGYANMHVEIAMRKMFLKVPATDKRKYRRLLLEVKSSGEESSRLLGAATLPEQDLAAPREPQISTKPIAM